MVENIVQRVDFRFGNHREYRQVDGIHAFAQYGALTTALAGYFVAQKRRGILKIVTGNNPAESLTRWQGLAITGVDVPDLTFGDRHQADFVHGILPPPIT